MATKETVYEAVVALRAESTQLRTDMSVADALVKSGVQNMGGYAKAFAGDTNIATAGVRKMGGAVSIAVGQLDALGPAAGKLGGILTSLVSTGFTPWGLAIVGVTAGMGYLVNKFDEAGEASKKIEQTQIAAVEAGRKNSEAIRERAAETARLTAAHEKERQAIGLEIGALQFSRATLFTTGDALIKLTTEQKINALMTSEQATKHVDLTKIMAGEIMALSNLKRAQGAMNEGQTAVGKFEQQFNVTFDSTKKSASQESAQLFAAVANQFKNNPKEQANLGSAFRSFVEQSIKEGTPDIPELMRSVGLTDLSGLTFALGPELLKGMQDSEQAGQQWGETMKKETLAMQESFGQIGKAMGVVKGDLEALREAAAQNLTLSMDTSNAESGIARVQTQLEIMRTQIANINATPVKVVQ